MRILCPERAFPQLVQLGVIAGCVLLDRIGRNAALCFALVAAFSIVRDSASATSTA